MINIDELKKISQIIENDKTSSTYKYVLMKNVIDICQRFEHLIQVENDKAYLPLGLVVEGWVFDYLPFVYQGIRQQHHKKSIVLNREIELAYQQVFKELKLDSNNKWEYVYKSLRDAFDNPYKSVELQQKFFNLTKEIRKTIISMPMRFTGKIDYEIFQPVSGSFQKIKDYRGINSMYLIENFGYFTISHAHYLIFRHLGQSLYGISTISKKWKEKTAILNGDTLSDLNLIDRLSFKNFGIEHNTSEIRSILCDGMECIWSGQELTKRTCEIDHVLPFSVWFNNDLWNLLPADKKINNLKKDKIPSPLLIEKRADTILQYWKLYHSRWETRFLNEMVSLVDNRSQERYFEKALESLICKATYLINDRGLQPWIL